MILHLGRKTLGDKDFLSRWEEVDEVTAKIPGKLLEMEKIKILVVDQYTNVTQGTIKRFPNLKHVCSPTTGHTHLQFDEKSLNITLVTLRGEVEFLNSITSTAEMTIYFIMRLARDIANPPIKLAGKTMGIVGYGRIGKQVEKACLGIGMRVITYDVNNSIAQLYRVFHESDFLSLHLF